MNIASLREVVSAEEWQLRVDLAAAYRLVALYGWSDLVFTHISARIPGPEHHFLINPYGLMFDEITASSLVKVDQDCNKLSDSPFPVNPAGFPSGPRHVATVTPVAKQPSASRSVRASCPLRYSPF